MTEGGGGGVGAGSRSLQTHLLDTSGKKKMYSAKTKFFKQLLRGYERFERKVVVARKPCGGRREGVQERRSLGRFMERKGEASKTLNIYFCLCVIKEILAITGVFFLPGMKQK